MDYLLMLTKDTNIILKPFAIVLGYIMEGIFWVLDKIGIPNIGLAIILFTVIIYVLMLPLTIKQQKFSKLSAKMNPEIQAIQAKYKGKSDQDSMMRMQQETQMVYAKYGVSPSGSCVQLLIQMPILFALYRVIYNMPAYVGKIKEAFIPLTTELVKKQGSSEFLQTLNGYNFYKKNFTNELFGATTLPTGIEYTQNTYISVLNRNSTAEWQSLADKFPDLSSRISDTVEKLDHYNNFLGLNIGNSPSFIITTEWNSPERSWLIILGVCLIPVLAALTQWINTKLMPQPENKKSEENAMMSSMKTMNTVMPLMSAFFCITLPVGMGIYWIAGSVVRSIIQICVNKHLDKIDIDGMIKANMEKHADKFKNSSIPAKQIVNSATINTKNIENKRSKADIDKDIKESTHYYNNNTDKPGSLASKAAMVKRFNEKQ